MFDTRGTKRKTDVPPHKVPFLVCAVPRTKQRALYRPLLDLRLGISSTRRSFGFLFLHRINGSYQLKLYTSPQHRAGVPALQRLGILLALLKRGMGLIVPGFVGLSRI